MVKTLKPISVSEDTLKLLYQRVSKIRTSNLKAGIYKMVSYDSVIYDLLKNDEDEDLKLQVIDNEYRE